MGSGGLLREMAREAEQEDEGMGWGEVARPTAGAFSAAVAAASRSGLPVPQRVLSVDVFDTMLVRMVGREDTAFLRTGQQLSDDGIICVSPESYARMRVDAERTCRRRLGHDPTLLQICAEVARRLPSRPDPEALQHAELTIEHHTIRAVPGAAAGLAATRLHFGLVAFVSDMYLEAQILRKWLVPLGCRSDDIVVTSLDARASKHRGDLHARMVAKYADGHAKRIWHVGNNLRADVAMARAHGITAVPATAANFNRYEQRLADHQWASEGLAGAFAGASRHARLTTMAARPEASRATVEVASGVAAPFIVSYGLWLLHQLRQSGIRRALFAARDCEVVLDVTRILATRLGHDVDLRYLHVSRRAMRLARLAVEPPDQPVHEWILENAAQHTHGYLAERIGVDLDRVEAVTGTALGREDEVVGRAGVDVWAAVLAEPKLHALLADELGPQRNALLAYLHEAGLDGTPSALVDLGWHGSIAADLTALAPDAAAATRLMLVGRIRPAAAPSMPTDTYLFDDIERDMLPFKGFLALLEVFCQARHGQVVGHRTDSNGRPEPVLAAPSNSAGLAWGLDGFREAVTAVAESCTLDTKHPWRPYADVRPAVLDVLRMFWLSPTPDEAETWGSLPFAMDDLDRLVDEIGRPYTTKELLGLLRGRRPPGRLWRFGAWQRSSTPIRALRGASHRVRGASDAFLAYRTRTVRRSAIR